MSYHPAIELYAFAARHPALARNIEATEATLDQYYGTPEFNMVRAKSLFFSNARSAARMLTDLHQRVHEVDHYRRTFRNRDVHDACASIMLYNYIKERSKDA